MEPLLDLLHLFAPGLLVGAALYAVLPWVPREARAGRIILITLSLALTWRYVAWRLFASLPEPSLSADFLVGLVFAAVETLTLIGTTITFVFLMRWRSRTPDVAANAGWLEAQWPFLPLVDVLICTYNEEKTILERTINGALAMDYVNCRIWVLDDGRRPWLKELCEETGARYLARPDNRHAKAGNINHALKHIAGLEEQPAFVAILDADFVPKASFLARTVCLMRDDSVGIVQTPQHFINPDPIQTNLFATDVWPDEQRYFFDVLMPSKDAWGAAFCCGTSSLIRYSALRRIGGLPTASVTEDYLLTLALREFGYRTVYLNEKLSLGLAPEGLKEYITQRARWCLGLIQICRSAHGPLRRNRLRLIDRISLIETFLYWSASYALRVLCLIVPVLYWLFEVEAVHADVKTALSYFLPFFVCQIGVTVWLAEGRMLPVLAEVSQLLTAAEILKSVTIGLVRPQGHTFKVTAKGGVRDQRRIEWPVLNPFLALLALTVTGVVASYWQEGGHALRNAGALCLFWSWYNIAVLVVAVTICIEQPRHRRDDRIRVEETASLIVGGRRFDRKILDLSPGGLRVQGSLPAPVGTVMTVELGELQVEAVLSRLGRRDFGLMFDDAPAAKDAILRYIYSGVDRAKVLQIRSTEVAAAVVGRVFR
jgi:cellulose synthase (UDP-forming)